MNRVLRWLIATVLVLGIGSISYGTQFPNTVDTDSDLYQVAPDNYIYSYHHNALKDAIKAIEQTVGSLTSVDPTSISYKIRNILGRSVLFDSGSKPRAVVFIPAGAWTPSLANGATESGAIEVGTVSPKTIYPLEFGDIVPQKADYVYPFPPNASYGYMEWRAVFMFKTAPTVGQTIKWGYSAVEVADSQSLDVAYTNTVTSTFTVPASPAITKIYRGAWGSGITLTGSAPGIVSMRIFRDITDTATVNCYLLGVEARYSVNKPDAN